MIRVYFLILAAALMIMSACNKEDIEATGIEFYPTIAELTLEIGDTETMKAFVIPDNATDKEVTWVSDKPAIALVNNKGEVTAKAIGTATITVATREGGHTANWIVEVIPAGQKKMTITMESDYEVNFLLGGKNTFTIDWNDGSAIETNSFTRQDYLGGYSHSYADRSSKTITFTGGNISHLSIESKIISLDVSDNIALSSLNCNSNGLKELHVSNNTILKHLSCNYNQLESLDLSNNTILKSLSCNVNQLESLDLSKNTSLTSLSCRGNSLTIMDLSNNDALTVLKCDNNQLRMLDVSKNTALIDLICYNNQLGTDALNALFKTLHSNAGTKNINIAGNPGTNECDRSIAINKGWTVTDSIPIYQD
jgi:hypothetical protein